MRNNNSKKELKTIVTANRAKDFDPFGEIKSEIREDVININMTISRGDKLEAQIDWSKLKTLYVLDETGNKINFYSLFERQKTIIILIRHFLDFITKEYVEDIAIIPLEYIQKAGVNLIVIGPAQPKHIKYFKALTNLPYTLYVDPEREVYKALGCLDKIQAATIERSRHIKSGFVIGMLSSIWRAMTSPDKEYQGDIKQQGGAFVFGPGEICQFNHIDQTSTDLCPLNELLSNANVANVSFPKDPRIEII